MDEKVLLSEISRLQNNGVSEQVLGRYNDFKSFARRSEEEWFSELCFCLLTANSSALSGIKVQSALGFEGFYNLPEKKLSSELKNLGYRFYNSRAEFIAEARKHFGLKEKLSGFADDRLARGFLVETVKGLGFKEASHFLRNTGHDNVAILDRHILRLMREHSLIKEMPKTLNEKTYLAAESELDKFAVKAGLNHSLLDLYLWYMKTGKVLK